MFRSAQVAVLLACILAVGHLGVAGRQAVLRDQNGRWLVMAPVAAVAVAALLAWLRCREAVARLPRHVQGRIATGAWLLLLLVIFAVMEK